MKIKIKETAKSKKNYSLYRLARVMEIPEQTIYSWAKGKSQPSYENLDKLCDTLECKIEDLLEAEPDRKSVV